MFADGTIGNSCRKGNMKCFQTEQYETFAVRAIWNVWNENLMKP